jgi:type I restriction enzyme R subunit
VDGVTVEYRTPDGEIRGTQARVLDFENIAANDWLAVNKFTVVGNKHSRRPDIVLFINGLPLAVVELKNAADEKATSWTAFQQLQTYKAEIPVVLRHERAAGHLRRRRSACRHAHCWAQVVQALAYRLR